MIVDINSYQRVGRLDLAVGGCLKRLDLRSGGSRRRVGVGARRVVADVFRSEVEQRRPVAVRSGRRPRIVVDHPLGRVLPVGFVTVRLRGTDTARRSGTATGTKYLN